MDLNEIYSDFVESNEPLSAEALGWSNETVQKKRFQIISEIGIKSKDSVLDVGCGYGDFSVYVGKKYLGIDMRDHAVEAAREKYKTRSFQTGDIFGITEKFDWIIASGIFSFKYENWEEDTFNTIKKMFDLSNKGVAVNFLSPTKQEKYESLKYPNPADVIDMISRISNNFALRHDYELHDFTVYLYKK